MEGGGWRVMMINMDGESGSLWCCVVMLMKRW